MSPKTEKGLRDTWIGVGGPPESVLRTARHGFDMMLAVIGGPPARFAPYVDLYHRAAMHTLGVAPFDLVYGFGPMDVAARERTVHLFGDEVVPRVREMLAERPDPPAPGAANDVAADTGSLPCQICPV